MLLKSRNYVNPLETEILKVTLNVPKTILVIIGGSGSGKSVLVKHIIGLFQPTKVK